VTDAGDKVQLPSREGLQPSDAAEASVFNRRNLLADSIEHFQQ
jgi:hypothetical protein